jgi:hypothetical protein
MGTWQRLVPMVFYFIDRHGLVTGPIAFDCLPVDLQFLPSGNPLLLEVKQGILLPNFPVKNRDTKNDGFSRFLLI